MAPVLLTFLTYVQGAKYSIQWVGLEETMHIYSKMVGRLCHCNRVPTCQIVEQLTPR